MGQKEIRIYLSDLIDEESIKDLMTPMYREEPILVRAADLKPKEKLPSLLRAARSLEKGAARLYQNRRSLFLKQAKLLENYEDDYSGEEIARYYYPTYDVLSDAQLRSYFAWRTKVRRGDIQPSCESYAFLYLYELINRVGAETPVDGLHKMDAFVDAYRDFASSLDYYYSNWRKSYIIYYNLSDSFLGEEERNGEEKYLDVLNSAPEQSDEAIINAVKQFAPSWLGRSKFYRNNQADMDKLIARVLRRMNQHYAARSKRTFSEQLFGSRTREYFELFNSAVFCDPLKHEDSRYYISDTHFFECENGYWSETSYFIDKQKCQNLENLMKYMDASLRVALGDRYPIQAPVQLKWVSKVIAEEIATLLEEKKQAEKAAQRIAIDYSALERIRRDAAITQEKLAVEEEIEPELPAPPQPKQEPEPQPQPDGYVLDRTEYRLMQCLLYGGDTGWVQKEGKMLSVLLDSINEKLYDSFQDSVIADDRVVEDYIDELKEMVKP